MRVLLLTVLITAPVSAQSPYLEGKELQEAISKCQGGCVVLNRQQASEFERQLGEILTNKQAEAFKAGVRYQQQACASLI
jgi:hypothetical protein